MLPGTLNLTLRTGDTFSFVLTCQNPATGGSGSNTPIDLTGCAAEMQIVSTYNIAPVYSLSSVTPTANGGTIVLGGTAGTISISIPPDDTLGLAAGKYDLKVKFADGSIQTIVTGGVFVEREVTVWS